MTEIYTFYEKTIWSAAIITILIYFSMYLNGFTKRVSLLISLSPVLMIVLAIFLAGFTYSFYPASLNWHTVIMMFIYIPIFIVMVYFYIEKEKRKKEKFLKAYVGIITFLFLMSAIYHPVPNGPSFSNAWDEGDIEYNCQETYYKVERDINKYMIGCADEIFKWAYNIKTHICEISRNSKDNISIIDTQDNEYLFNESCEFKRRITR